ncbi:hypothetical protein [Maricaulis sp. CAU 1757]
MSRTAAIWVAGLAILAAGSATGGLRADHHVEPPAAVAAELRSELAPLEFLAGKCFTGVFPGSETFDVHCFTPVLGGQFLRDVHAVPQGGDVYRGETLYHWDAEAQVIRYRYYNSLGGTSDGTAQPQPDGSIRFPDETYAQEGEAPRVFTTEWRRRGDGGYDVSTAEIVDGEPTGGMTVEFEPISREMADELIQDGL